MGRTFSEISEMVDQTTFYGNLHEMQGILVGDIKIAALILSNFNQHKSPIGQGQILEQMGIGFPELEEALIRLEMSDYVHISSSGMVTPGLALLDQSSPLATFLHDMEVII